LQAEYIGADQLPFSSFIPRTLTLLEIIATTAGQIPRSPESSH
jgi:hypothetical protein